MDSAVIVGAGAFGSSLAWQLARDGVAVTLVDRFDPGDPRTTSGGESRLIRCGHGADATYTASARRARKLWRELEGECGEELMIECGLVWMAHAEHGFEAASATTMSDQGIPCARLDPAEGDRFFPSFGAGGLAFLLHEPEAGVLRAQRATQALARRAAAHGAEVLRAVATPDGDRVRLDDGRTLEADVAVWACGAWLGALFPAHVDIRSTRQELFFFDGGPAWAAPDVPAYVDFDHAIYGTRDLDGLGVKAAPDFDGPPLAPDAELPPATPDSEALSRAFLRERFPALADAPLAGSKTCRYELTCDAHFVAAPLPEYPSVWLLGGGSGHGFKHAPALGEAVAAALRDGAPLPPQYGLGPREALAGMFRTAGAVTR